jgi:hypothetical protein
MTDEEFYQLCHEHDWTYQFTDDHSVWQRGRDAELVLYNAAKDLPARISLLQEWKDFHAGEASRFAREK